MDTRKSQRASGGQVENDHENDHGDVGLDGRF